MDVTPALQRSRRAGFTLLEVITVLVIVLILVVMLLPLLSYIQERAATTRCTANLKSLHVGADLYLQDHLSWPQIAVSGMIEQDTAKAWIAALRPYGLEPSGLGVSHFPEATREPGSILARECSH